MYVAGTPAAVSSAHRALQLFGFSSVDKSQSQNSQ
jgi:hypothetical protein